MPGGAVLPPPSLLFNFTIQSFKMSKNDPEYYHGIGKDIVLNGIFERFPELIPYVGENYYSDNHKRLIFIGESNYFPASFDPLLEKIKRYGDKTLLPLSPQELQSLRDFIEVFPDEQKWYKEYTGKPIPESIKSFVGNAIDYKTFNNVFRLIKGILKDETEKSGLEQVAFYNYFLRPAVDNGKTKGFKPQALDREVAGAALCGIIECLQPQVIVFLSKKAFEAFDKYLRDKNLNYDDIKILWAYHPASRRHWWRGLYGKTYLENILKESWVERK